MPNEVTYVDESTKTKAMKALFGEGALDFGQVLAAVERLEAAGIIFREPVETKPRGRRTKAEDDADREADKEADSKTHQEFFMAPREEI